MSDQAPIEAPVKKSDGPKDKGSLTMTIPAKIRQAMQALADKRGLGEDVPELLKNLLLLAYQAGEGCTFKLEPVPDAPLPFQAELPLTSEVCAS